MVVSRIDNVVPFPADRARLPALPLAVASALERGRAELRAQSAARAALSAVRPDPRSPGVDNS